MIVKRLCNFTLPLNANIIFDFVRKLKSRENFLIYSLKVNVTVVANYTVIFNKQNNSKRTTESSLNLHCFLEKGKEENRNIELTKRLGIANITSTILN